MGKVEFLDKGRRMGPTETIPGLRLIATRMIAETPIGPATPAAHPLFPPPRRRDGQAEGEAARLVRLTRHGGPTLRSA